MTAPALDSAHSGTGSVASSSPKTDALRVQTFTSFEDAQTIRAEWNDLVAELNGSLYSTPTWCEVWWRHYGSGRELRLVAVRAGETLVGVLPFFIDCLGLLVGRSRVAKLVGCDHTVALFEPPVLPTTGPQAFKLAMHRLVVEDRVDLVHLGPCPGEGSGQLEMIRQAIGALGNLAETVRDRQSGSYTVFDMPDGFEAYLSGLSKNQRHSYRRNLNKLRRTFEFEVDVVRDGAELEREFDAFVAMHQAQWQAAGKLGHFGDWPGSRAFALDLVRTLAPEDRVRLMRLVANGEVVAYHWCLSVGDTCHSRLTGRVTGEQLDQFSFGRIGQLKMMEVASADGARIVEAGTGRYEYKEKLNGRTMPVRSVALCRRGLVPRLRSGLTLSYADLLHLLYYRAWYLKVAPRVRILRRPLWRSWIRTRF